MAPPTLTYIENATQSTLLAKSIANKKRIFVCCGVKGIGKSRFFQEYHTSNSDKLSSVNISFDRVSLLDLASVRNEEELVFKLLKSQPSVNLDDKNLLTLLTSLKGKANDLLLQFDDLDRIVERFGQETIRKMLQFLCEHTFVLIAITSQSAVMFEYLNPDITEWIRLAYWNDDQINVFLQNMAFPSNSILTYLFKLCFNLLRGHPGLCTEFVKSWSWGKSTGISDTKTVFEHVETIYNGWTLPKRIYSRASDRVKKMTETEDRFDFAKGKCWKYLCKIAAKYETGFTTFCLNWKNLNPEKPLFLMNLLYEAIYSDYLSNNLRIESIDKERMNRNGWIHLNEKGTPLITITELIRCLPVLPIDLAILSPEYSPDANEICDVGLRFLKEYWPYVTKHINNSSLIMRKDGVDYYCPKNFKVLEGNAFGSVHDVIQSTPKEFTMRKNAPQTPSADSCIIFVGNDKHLVHFIQSKRGTTDDLHVNESNEVMKVLFDYKFKKRTDKAQITTSGVFSYQPTSNSSNFTVKYSTEKQVDSILRDENTYQVVPAQHVVRFDLIGDFDTPKNQLPNDFKDKYLKDVSVNTYGRERQEEVYGMILGKVRELRSKWKQVVSTSKGEGEGNDESIDELYGFSDDDLMREYTKVQTKTKRNDSNVTLIVGSLIVFALCFVLIGCTFILL